MFRLQSLPRVFLFAVISFGLFVNANGQPNADASDGAFDVRIYLISSDLQGAGTPIPAELREIAGGIAKASGTTGQMSIAADFMARAATGSIVDGRGFIEFDESEPLTSLDWRIGQINSEGVGSANLRYLLLASRFSLRTPISLTKPRSGEGEAPHAYDVATFSSSRSVLRAGVPAVLGNFTLAKPKRDYYIVAVVLPLALPQLP